MKAVDYVIEKLGLVCSRAQTVRREIEIIHYEDAIWESHPQPVFMVYTDDVTDIFAHRLDDKKNAYIDALQEYLHGLHKEYGGSALQVYFDEFQPDCIEKIFINRKTVYKTDRTPGLFEYTLPWDSEAKRNNGNKLNYSGPMSIERGKFEYERLIKVFESIKAKGYCPKYSTNLFNSNHIQGYFLSYGEKYRFVVLHGKHRAAALKVLGEPMIPVTFEFGKPRVVRLSDIEFWPQVRNHHYSKKQAEEIFLAFFEE